MLRVLLVILITFIFIIPVIYVAFKLTVQHTIELKPQLISNYELVYGRLPILDNEYVFVIGSYNKINKYEAVKYGCIKTTELHSATNMVNIKEESYKRICGKHRYDDKKMNVVGILKVKKDCNDSIEPYKMYSKSEVIK